MSKNYPLSIRENLHVNAKSRPLTVGLLLKLFLFAAFVLMFGVQRSSATHLAGGNITYTCTSSPNTYNVRITVYRDCKGIALLVPSLTVTGCGNTISIPYTGPAVTPIVVTQPCNASVRTACDVPAGTAPGIQRYDYNFTYTLPATLANCADVMFYYDVSARNGAITTLANPGGENMRIEAHLNAVAAPCNSSPGFNIDPILFLCLGKQNCFNFGATEPNGDSITYTWMTPLGIGGGKVIYFGTPPQYDSAHALTGTQTLNASTGDICLTPSLAGQVAVLALKVTERRLINGVWTVIGTVERDIQLYMISCANDLPALTGVDGDTLYTKNACAGGQVCFNVYSNDTNAVDSTKIIVPPGSLPLNATFTITPGKRSFGTFCMPTTAADAGKSTSFTLIVRDNACPQNGQQSYTYQINLFGITATTTSTSPKCFGGNNGTATITATGTAPFTYTWSTNPVQTTQTATGLGSGTYCATATASGGCSVTQCVAVDIPTPLIATAIRTNVSCNAGSNGTATVNSVSGGTGAYSYLWSTSPVQTTATALNLPAGSYCVTITDANGCTNVQCVNVTQPTPLNVTSSNTSVSCNGGSNGTAHVVATGGTPGYNYVWSPGSKAGQDIMNLTAGTYCALITDANGCTAQKCEIVTQPTAVAFQISNLQNVACTQLGSFDIVASGGTGAYTYLTSSSPSQATSHVSNLVQGTYTVTVRDANGCRATGSVAIGGSNAITATESHTNPLCNGAATGTATITASGSSNYTYSWLPNVSSTNVATGLNAGSYNVIVTSGSCSAPVTVVITQPSALAVTETHNNINCSSGNTGSINVSVSGGTGSYTYNWNPNVSNSSSASGLSGGTYIVTITDANNCSATKTIVVTQSTPILVTETHTNVSCNGDNDGSITLTTTGGTGPYTYNWIPSVSNSSSATGLTAGTYNISIQDANGCPTSQTVVITEPAALKSTESHTDVTCDGAHNGTASITVTGGTGAYAYFWNPSISNSNTATGLSAGTYIVTVRDSNFCTATKQIIIAQPSPLDIGVNHVDATCCQASNGAIILSVSGGTGPYTYSWNPNVSTTSSATMIPAGTYSVVISDANGCSASRTVVVGKPIPMTVVIDQANVTCNGGSNGSISLSVSGGTAPYVYSWSPNVSTSNSASGLTAGTYVVTITDAKCCTITRTIVLKEAPPLNLVEYHANLECCAGSTGTIILAISGGAAPYTFNWSPNVSSNATASELAAGTYSVVVTDANGCSASKTIVIEPCQAIGRTVDNHLPLSALPTEFILYPNPAHESANIKFSSEASSKYSIRLINLEGKEARYETVDAVEGVNEHQISFDNVARGIYMIIVENGNSRFIKKIVVE